ncbi:5'-nucleotidase C-terminal domain-containing protein [Marinicrinis lubricantis]|uniref:5'-nucleotidase C-terminal domain-containing protein n=1 Tax=Marinicrinis lubricantis TaxID=2086470 RepID=A0ABW1IRZ2_9BACL
MNKLATSAATLLLTCSLLTGGRTVQASSGFSDIEASAYTQQIEALYQRGIINGTPEGLYQPQRQLTKAEAVTLLSRAFHLSPVYPIERNQDDMQKTTTYTDPLGVIDDSFSIPSARDIEEHWALPYIESVLKVRGDETNGNTYDPQALVTKSEWVELLGKIILGADLTVDYKSKMAELGLASPEYAASSEPITREEAAGSLYDILYHPDFKIITVFATADIHAHLEPYKPAGSENEIGGLAKMSHVIDQMREVQPNTLLIDAGDAPYNTNIGNLTEGAATIEIMNEMQYDAMVLGNHDFDFPFDVLERNAGDAQFPFLSANTRYNGEQPDFLKSSIIKEIDGIRIGIIGVTDDQSHHFTHPKNVEGITFQDHFEAAQNTVSAIQDETDIIIALSHLHGDNRQLPTEVSGIDIEIGGGQDIVAYPEQIGDTWLISPGKHAETLNQINLQFLNGEMIGLNFAHLFMTYNLEQDAAVTNIIDRHLEEIGGKMNEVVGKTLTPLDGERQTVRLKESNLGNAIADSLVDLTGADIALQNGGGVRASIDEGDITLEEIYTVLPFDNTVVMVEASGQTIWDALEHSVSSYPSAAGSFLQVSGLSYTFDAAKEPGSRLVEVLVDGEPIELTKMYKVAANDFLTGGGDHFDMLKDETTELLKTKHFLRDAFTEYLQSHGTIEPQLEQRIHILNPASEQ